MKCVDRKTQFSEAAGRDVDICTKFDGAEPFAGALNGFALAPAGVNPLWGGLAGAGVAGLTTLITNKYLGDQANESVSVDANQKKDKYSIYAGLGATALVSGIMIAIKKTRVAGYAALGAGLATELGAYIYLKNREYSTWMGAMGMHTARTLQGSPVRVMNGAVDGVVATNELDGVVASRMLQGAGEIEVMNGAAPFGSNFTNIMK
jgi:hypothetical protein